MRNRLQQLIHHRHVAFFIIALALILVLPSLAAGLLADDYAHLLRLTQPDVVPEKAYPGVADLFALIYPDQEWRAQQMAYSILPWWTSEQIQIVFFRPLAEVSHLIDSYLWPNHAWLMHAHNLIWYGALLMALYAVYRKLFTDRSVALLALLLFAVDATHGFTVAWIANRNALMAACFLLLSLRCFIAWRELNQNRYAVLTNLFLILSLLSAEAGVSTLFYLALYLLLIDSQASWRKYLTLLPSLAIVLLWLVFYRLNGFGATGSYYLDPIAESSAFLFYFPERFFTAIAMQFNVLPLHLMDRFHLAISLTGALIFAALGYFVHRHKTPLARFALATLTLSILPVAAAHMQERNLIIVGIVGSALLALIIDYCWRLASFWRHIVILVVFFHIVLSALMLVPMSYAPALLGKNVQRAAIALPEVENHQALISVGLPLMDSAFLMMVNQLQERPRPARYWHITSRADANITQENAYTWHISHEAGLLRKEDFLLRDIQRESFTVGQEMDIHGAKISVLALNPSGIPTAVRLQLVDLQLNVKGLRWQHPQWQVLEFKAQ